MIGYILIGTNDYPKAQEFYDKLFEGLGVKRLMESDRITMYAASADQPIFGICTPANGEPATFGNGTMIALPVDSHEAVDKFRDHALSIDTPEVSDINHNADLNFYGVYLRDHDHNKICVYHMKF